MMLGTEHAMKDTQILSLALYHQSVEQVTEIKMLGVTLNQTMSWSSHNNSMAKMSIKALFIRCNTN